MADQTSRLSLPLLAAGQAQKELTHNAALALLDTLVQPIVEDFGTDTPPSGPSAGQSWILGAAPTGDWSGQAYAIATWGDGGWRSSRRRKDFGYGCAPQGSGQAFAEVHGGSGSCPQPQ